MTMSFAASRPICVRFPLREKSKDSLGLRLKISFVMKQVQERMTEKGRRESLEEPPVSMRVRLKSRGQVIKYSTAFPDCVVDFLNEVAFLFPKV